MKLRSLCASALSLLVVAGALFPISAFAGDKRRVAVMPFEYGAVTTSVGTVDVGKGIVSLLQTRLLQDGTFAVYDRQMFDAILKEKNFSVSDRADPTTAIKIGKLAGVDAMIVGTVTQMGVDSRSSAVSVPSVGMGYIPYVGSLPGLGTFRSKKAQAKVAIDAKIIDTGTGEILASVSGTGESTKKGSWVLNDSWDWSTSDFKDSVAGEAIIQAVDKMAAQITAAASKIPDNQSLAAQNVQGKIAYVKDRTVILNVGQINGIKVGDNLQVEQVKEEIKDPTSGRVLKTLTNTVAVINITEVDKESSTGNIARGAGIKVGDLVKKVTTDVSAVILASPPAAATAATAVKKPVTK